MVQDPLCVVSAHRPKRVPVVGRGRTDEREVVVMPFRSREAGKEEEQGYDGVAHGSSGWASARAGGDVGPSVRAAGRLVLSTL